jgi:hypothetical protein
VKQETQEQLDAAEQNLRLAVELSRLANLQHLPATPTLEWALLAAYYAADFYAGAVIAELSASRIVTSGDRLAELARRWGVRPIPNALGSYLRLRDQASARPEFPAAFRMPALRLTRALVDDALHNDLRVVAATACSTLGVAALHID